MPDLARPASLENVGEAHKVRVHIGFWVGEGIPDPGLRGQLDLRVVGGNRAGLPALRRSGAAVLPGKCLRRQRLLLPRPLRVGRRGLDAAGGTACVRADIVMDTGRDADDLLAALGRWAEGKSGVTIAGRSPIVLTSCG